MSDLTLTIVPKSDQLNSDDLIAGPRTFTITEVRVKATAEQPVDIHLAESPGKPFRPSKTVLRILVTAWGKEGDDYVGRRMTLYRDAEVKWAGQEVGGIRVSHLSNIRKAIKLALTETRGKKVSHTIQPLPDAPPEPVQAQRPTESVAIRVGKMVAAFAAQHVDLDRLEAKVGKSRAEWTDADVTAAAAWYKAITDGGADVDEMFPDPDVTVPEQTTLPDEWVEEPPADWTPDGAA